LDNTPRQLVRAEGHHVMSWTTLGPKVQSKTHMDINGERGGEVEEE